MTENDQNICKLLLAIAGGTNAQESGHDVIFKAASTRLSRLAAERDALKKATPEKIVEAFRSHFGKSVMLSVDGIERCYYNGWAIREIAELLADALATPSDASDIARGGE